MFSGDYLLVEVDISINQIDRKSAFLRSDLVLEYCSLPLSILGVAVGVKDIEVREVESLSVFQSAKSVATYCRNATVNGQALTDIPLSYDHRYDFTPFTKEIAEVLGVEVIASETRGSAGIILAKKV